MKSEWLWNRLAKHWDTPGVSLGENDIRIIEKAKKFLKPGDTVMDYGCATGSIALAIAPSVKKVHGIDISANMIDFAAKKAVEQKTGNAVFTKSTIFDDRLKKESYDVVLCFATMHLIPDTPKVFRQIYTLLKPGGYFISATPCPGEWTLKSILITVGLFFVSKIGLLPYINFFSVSRLTNNIKHANFRIHEIEKRPGKAITEAFIVAQKV
jgi:2-polyprenyl-3-methyl-5-hydroxy-6-metoxy-1,4-benzoquinol methylase